MYLFIPWLYFMKIYENLTFPICSSKILFNIFIFLTDFHLYSINIEVIKINRLCFIMILLEQKQ